MGRNFVVWRSVVRKATEPPPLLPTPTPSPGHRLDAEIEAERIGWYEVLALVHSLEADEVIEPGYYRDNDRSVADLIAHLGTWLLRPGSNSNESPRGQ
jgi:hypothetical protein